MPQTYDATQGKGELHSSQRDPGQLLRLVAVATKPVRQAFLAGQEAITQFARTHHKPAYGGLCRHKSTIVSVAYHGMRTAG